MCSSCYTIILKNDTDYKEIVIDQKLREDDIIDLIDFCDDRDLGFNIDPVNTDEKTRVCYFKITFFKKRKNIPKIEKFYNSNMDIYPEDDGILFDRHNIDQIPNWCGVYIYETITNEKYVGKSKGSIKRRIKNRNEMICFIKDIRVYFTKYASQADDLEKKLISMIKPSLNRNLTRK